MRAEQKSQSAFWFVRLISVLAMFDGAQALASECVVDGWLRGTTLANVRPTGAEKFRIALFEGIRATASISKGGIKLSVKEPLTFLATAESLVVRVSRPVVAANGQPWLHVRRDGRWASITGWIQESALDGSRGRHQDIGTETDGCFSSIPSGSSGFDIEYEGPARVRAGTVVGPGAWARVPEETKFSIVVRSDKAEAAIRHLPGMSLVPKSVDAFFDFYRQWIPAWIPRSAIILPDTSNVRDAAAPAQVDH